MIDDKSIGCAPIEQLKNSVSNIGDCVIITSDINRRYFTGMKSSAGTLLVFSSAAYLIIDFRYIEKARKIVDNCEVILQDKLYDQINDLLRKHDAKTALIESENCTVSQAELLSEKLNSEVISDSKLSSVVNQIRRFKSNEEIAKIKSAQKIAENGFEHMLNFIKAGKTEREIQLELDYFMLKNGAEALSFDTIAISGKNTSLPHGVPTDKIVENGDFVLMDFGAVVDGYHSDMTRTVCVGQPSDEMKSVYDIVLNAQMKALASAKAGIICCELDSVARDYIKNAGYGNDFGHSLGHGVGVEIHEAPTVSQNCSEILRDGMIVTVEPGIYLADKFGVRIEDFVVIRENGIENLTCAAKELIIL